MFKTEIEAFLISQGVSDFVSVAMEISLEDYKKLSDFERFSLVCEHSESLLGSDVIDTFLHLICVLRNGKFRLPELKNREVQKSVWRALHGDFLISGCSFSSAESYCVDYYNLYNDFEYADIIKLILKESCDALEDFIEKLYFLNINSFLVISSEFEYIRPNRYIAEKIYKKILCGEKCKKSETGLLVSHIICCLGKHKECYVNFVADDDFLELDAFVELFEKRKSNVKISICFNPLSSNLGETIFALMLKNSKKISSEIIIPEDTDVDCIYNCMSQLLKTIPFAKIRVSATEKSNFEKAMELICKNQSL